MSRSRKYRSFGIRRVNNLSDITNPVEALSNLLNNLPGVSPQDDITFISDDLNAIRGLKDTNLSPDSFTQLAQTAPRTTRIDEQGQVVLDANGNLIEDVISPLVRFEDRIRQFRQVTENPPVFPSGDGPLAYFIPSNLIQSFTRNTKIEDQVEANLANSAVQTSDDYWVIGEFVLNDRLRVDFENSFGGVLWEGFHIPNPSSTSQSFRYETSGLFQVEYDRFNDGNWQVVKSIYAKKRPVIVETAATESTTIVLQEGESKYISVGDFIENNEENIILSIIDDTITLEQPITVTAGQTVTFDMPLGAGTTSGRYVINEVLDRGETPEIKKRIFWWFPNEAGYEPELKYLRLGIIGREVYDFFFWKKEASSLNPSAGSIRELLQNAVTPSQDVMGASSNYKEFKSSTSTESQYVPKSALSQVVNGTVNISFKAGNRSITGSFASTQLGNIIVPTNVASLNSVIPKNLRIKDLVGSNITSNTRIVNQSLSTDGTDVQISFIDHNGLVDYFVGSSTTNTVTVSDTSNLRPGFICVTGNTGVNDFIRISSIISSTQFTTTQNLSITNQYVFIYANAGIIDTSLDIFCIGVFGQVLSATATAGSNTLQLISAAGVTVGQVVQFGDSISAGVTVTNISGNTITISSSLAKTINQDETIVFAPSGTTVNKEICVLPLDLSPPFIGVDTGLDTGGKNIRSSKTTLNLKVEGLEFRNTVINNATTTETYNRTISIVNGGLSIIARKL